MSAASGSTNAQTQYRVRLEALSPRSEVPGVTLMLSETRSGGWSGTVNVDPQLTLAEEAFHTVLSDGLAPAGGVLVKLIVSGNTGHSGTAVRVWPSIVTSVSTTHSNTTYSSTYGTKRRAFCGITFRDPLSFYRDRPLWTAFAECSLGEILGGALSAAAGGDGKPTHEPVLPGMSEVRIREQLRKEIRSIPYAIAAGETLGYWLNRVCGRLGVRIQMRGELETGRLEIDLCDSKPSESDLNSDGGVTMSVKPDGAASATNLALGESAVSAPLRERGALLDNPAGGGARRFGRDGAVGTVVVAAQTGVEEAERRAGFRRGSRNLSQVLVSTFSRQPGLLPGRVVKVSTGLHSPPDKLRTKGPKQHDGVASLFGAKEWQVADVSHLYGHGHYWNRAELEKAGAAWRPAVAHEEGAMIVSGIVDDGDSETGALVERDRLGRIPIRFPFVVDAAAVEESASGENGKAGEKAPAGKSAGSSAGDIPWPPVVPLAPVKPIAGNAHGFISAQRQGDWCRVAVVNPLYAEIMGFCYRDDRYLNATVRDATMGMIVRQGGGQDWRGMLFRPDEDLEQELAEPDPEPERGDEVSGSQEDR